MFKPVKKLLLGDGAEKYLPIGERKLDELNRIDAPFLSSVLAFDDATVRVLKGTVVDEIRIESFGGDWYWLRAKYSPSSGASGDVGFFYVVAQNGARVAAITRDSPITNYIPAVNVARSYNLLSFVAGGINKEVLFPVYATPNVDSPPGLYYAGILKSTLPWKEPYQLVRIVPTGLITLSLTVPGAQSPTGESIVVAQETPTPFVSVSNIVTDEGVKKLINIGAFSYTSAVNSSNYIERIDYKTYAVVDSTEVLHGGIKQLRPWILGPQKFVVAYAVDGLTSGSDEIIRFIDFGAGTQNDVRIVDGATLPHGQPIIGVSGKSSVMVSRGFNTSETPKGISRVDESGSITALGLVIPFELPYSAQYFLVGDGLAVLFVTGTISASPFSFSTAYATTDNRGSTWSSFTFITTGATADTRGVRWSYAVKPYKADTGTSEFYFLLDSGASVLYVSKDGFTTIEKARDVPHFEGVPGVSSPPTGQFGLPVYVGHDAGCSIEPAFQWLCDETIPMPDWW